MSEDYGYPPLGVGGKVPSDPGYKGDEQKMSEDFIGVKGSFTPRRYTWIGYSSPDMPDLKITGDGEFLIDGIISHDAEAIVEKFREAIKGWRSDLTRPNPDDVEELYFIEFMPIAEAKK